MSALPATPFTPPRLALQLAHLAAVLASRRALADSAELSFDLSAQKGDWPAAYVFWLGAGDFDWKIEFSDIAFLEAQLPLGGTPLSRLPEGLQRAMLDAALGGKVQALSAALGVPALLIEPSPDTPVLPFFLEWHPAGQEAPVFVRVSGTAAEGLSWLAERIEAAWPNVRANPAAQGWSIPFSVCAASMRLAAAELDGLAAGDVLLPGDWLPAHGQAVLRPKTGGQAFRAKLAGGAIEIIEACEEEKPMKSNALEVNIRFCLGEKRLPLPEVLALGPGKVFSFAGEADAAVQLLVEGQPLAQGRLVDLDGTLGVQVLRLAEPSLSLPGGSPEEPGGEGGDRDVDGDEGGDGDGAASASEQYA